MKVKVVAPFDVPDQDTDGSVSLPEGARVRDLFRHAPAYTLLLAVSVNGKQVSRLRKLQDGDLVVVIAPITGG